MDRLKNALMAFAVLVLVLGPGTGAKADVGFYISLLGGANLIPDSIDGDLSAPGVATVPISLGADPGWAGGASIGFAFPIIGLRVEGEVMYRNNNSDDLAQLTGTLGIPNGTPLTSSIHNVAVMVNATVDIDLGMPFFTPYFGGGVGYNYSNINVSAGATLAGVNVADATESSFAYQAIAGIRFKAIPIVSVAIEYRLFGVSDTTFDAGGVVPGTTLKINGYISHSIMARVTFGF